MKIGQQLMAYLMDPRDDILPKTPSVERSPDYLQVESTRTRTAV